MKGTTLECKKVFEKAISLLDKYNQGCGKDLPKSKTEKMYSDFEKVYKEIEKMGLTEEFKDYAMI